MNYFIIETGRTLATENGNFFSVIIEKEGGAMGSDCYDIEKAVATSMTLAEAKESAKGWAYVVSEKKAVEMELGSTLYKN